MLSAGDQAKGNVDPNAIVAAADAHLQALLRYSGGFYSVAIERGIPAAVAADAVAHIERAAKALHGLVLAQAAGTSAAGGLHEDKTSCASLQSNPVDVPPGGEPRTHEIKSLPEHFEQLLDGSKQFELRRDDRGYAVNDRLVLREWTEEGGFSGRAVAREIVGMLRGPLYGLAADWAILSIRPLPAEPQGRALKMLGYGRAPGFFNYLMDNGSVAALRPTDVHWAGHDPGPGLAPKSVLNVQAKPTV